MVTENPKKPLEAEAPVEAAAIAAAPKAEATPAAANTPPAEAPPLSKEEEDKKRRSNMGVGFGAVAFAGLFAVIGPLLGIGAIISAGLGLILGGVLSGGTETGKTFWSGALENWFGEDKAPKDVAKQETASSVNAANPSIAERGADTNLQSEVSASNVLEEVLPNTRKDAKELISYGPKELQALRGTAKGIRQVLPGAGSLSLGKKIAAIGQALNSDVKIIAPLVGLKNTVQGWIAAKNSATAVSSLTHLKNAKNVLNRNPIASGLTQMGLIDAAIETGAEAKEYWVDGKEKNMENVSDTVIKVFKAGDPLRAGSGFVEWTSGHLNRISRGAIPKVDPGLNVSNTFGRLAGYEGDDAYVEVLEKKAETAKIYEEENKRFQPGVIDPSARVSTSDKPHMSDYRYLGSLNAQLKSYLPHGKINSKDIGDPKQFREIDFTKPENYTAYKRALNKMMIEQERIIHENNSIMPRSLRSGASLDAYNEADSKHNMLLAAEKEYALFENRVLEYNKEIQPTVAEVPLPSPPATPPGQPPVATNPASTRRPGLHYF